MEKEKEKKQTIWRDEITPLSQRTTSSGVRFGGQYSIEDEKEKSE